MEIIFESVAWVAVGFVMTVFGLKVYSKSRELSIKIGQKAYMKVEVAV